MTELEMFKYLLDRDPSPGKSNRIELPKRLSISIPGWVLGDQENEVITVSRRYLFKRLLEPVGITTQVLYDILMLGITSPTDRPRCVICGEPLKYNGISDGYAATCGKEECLREKIRKEVTNLWKDDSYRKHQIDKKIEWMNQPEYVEFFRERAKRKWTDKDYRDKQVASHIEFARLNPDKIHSNLYGDVECIKSETGSIKFDSSWERDFIQFCDSVDLITFIDRPGISIPYKFDKLTRNYIPDFKVTLSNGINLLVEIKGDWLLKEKQTKLKLKAGHKYVKSSDIYNDFLVLTENDLYVVQSKPVINSDKLINILTQYL